MKKRIIALLLLFGMFAMPNTAFAASVSDFSDLPDDWSRGAIERAIENGLLSGSNGRINASAQLTRAELAAIVVRAFGAAETASLSGFSDVAPSDWYYEPLQKAVAMGVLSGAHGKLNPTAPITREEVCAVLYRAFLLQDGGNAAQRFGDARQISDWAQAAVAAMAAKGYIAGDSGGNVNASKTITRAEFAQMMDNLVKGYPAGAQGGVIEGNAVMKSGSNLSGMTIKGDLILADGLGRSDVDLSDCIVEGRIIVRGGEAVRLSGTTRTNGVIAAASIKLTNNTNSKISLVSVESSSVYVSIAGEIGKVDVKADDVTINADSSAKIDIVETAAGGTIIQGSGEVTAVNVKSGASGTEVTTAHTEITVDSGAGTVISANGSLSAGQSGMTDNSGSLQANTAYASPSNSASSSGSGGNRRPNTGGSGVSRPSDGDSDHITVTAANGQSLGSFRRGTILTIDPANGEEVYQLTVNQPLSIANPARSGYVFKGWTVSGTAITARWAEAVEVKDSDGYIVGVFELGAVILIDPDNGTERQTLTVTAETVIPVPAKANHVFTGWKVEGTTVTAQWRSADAPAENVTVKDSENRVIGTFPIGTVLTIDKNNGTVPSAMRVAESTVIPVPVRTGYTFREWTVDGTRIIAQWTKNGSPVQTVVLKDSKGNTVGTFTVGTTLIVNYANGDAPITITVSADTQIPAPEREGYTFKSWTRVSDTEVRAEWTPSTPVKQKVTVTAANGQVLGEFEEGTRLTINLAGGGTNYAYTVGSDTPIATPKREGYIFKAWSVDVEGLTVTAQWEEKSPVEPEYDLHVTVIGSQARLTGTVEEMAGKRAAIVVLAPGYTAGAKGWITAVNTADYVTQTTFRADGSVDMTFPLKQPVQAGEYTLMVGGGEAIIVVTFQP